MSNSCERYLEITSRILQPFYLLKKPTIIFYLDCGQSLLMVFVLPFFPPNRIFSTECRAILKKYVMSLLCVIVQCVVVENITCGIVQLFWQCYHRSQTVWRKKCLLLMIDTKEASESTVAGDHSLFSSLSHNVYAITQDENLTRFYVTWSDATSHPLFLSSSVLLKILFTY